jgi:hypothetical protein
VQQGRDSVNAKNKVNKIVTVSHIGVTLAFSITQTLPFFFKNSTSLARIDSAFFLFGGMADLFLSIMMWYIFDDKKEKTIFVDGEMFSWYGSRLVKAFDYFTLLQEKLYIYK